MNTAAVVMLVLMLTSPVFFILWLLARKKLKRQRAEQDLAQATATDEIAQLSKKLQPITDIEAEADALRSGLATLQDNILATRAEYKEKKGHLDRLIEQVAIYDERLSFAELGMYEPHFDFSDSEVYKAAIEECRQKQKAMVSAKRAVDARTDWTVEGSKAKGQTMVNRQIKLTMRAFNNEAEAAIANVRWNNVNAMEKRIHAAVKSIDDSNASLQIKIRQEYIDLKIMEIRLTHEYRERLKIEKDERAEAARLSREEAKLQRDAEVAEREEAKYQALLDKARTEAEGAIGNKALADKVALLEAELAEAHLASERARAMAEMTRTGYVYVISNIGSFGEDVVKIGLTRRLDPNDRVRELGDASVPFTFDTHAMIYSENAPTLEAALHAEFAKQRINLQNMRKEFFRVSIDAVEEAVRRLSPDAAFFKDREAQEWHETLARRNASLAAMQAVQVAEILPAEI